MASAVGHSILDKNGETVEPISPSEVWHILKQGAENADYAYWLNNPLRRAGMASYCVENFQNDKTPEMIWDIFNSQKDSTDIKKSRLSYAKQCLDRVGKQDLDNIWEPVKKQLQSEYYDNISSKDTSKDKTVSDTIQSTSEFIDGMSISAKASDSKHDVQFDWTFPYGDTDDEAKITLNKIYCNGVDLSYNPTFKNEIGKEYTVPFKDLTNGDFKVGKYNLVFDTVESLQESIVTIDVGDIWKFSDICDWIEIKYKEVQRPRVLSIVNNIATILGVNHFLSAMRILVIKDDQYSPKRYPSIDIDDKGNFICYSFEFDDEIVPVIEWCFGPSDFIFFKCKQDLDRYINMIKEG